MSARRPIVRALPTHGAVGRLFGPRRRRAEQLELEDRSELSQVRWSKAADPKPALPHAREPVAIPSELAFKRWQLCWPEHVEPERVLHLELVAVVEHGEAVDLQPRSGCLAPGRRWLVPEVVPAGAGWFALAAVPQGQFAQRRTRLRALA